MKKVNLGDVPEKQAQAWLALFELSERLGDSRWTVVGGQMVYLHCAERGGDLGRVTTDVDALLDVRMDSRLFSRADTLLRSHMGFKSSVGLGGSQERWERDGVKFDILIPEVSKSIGESGSSIGGVPVQSPGANQALGRSEPISLSVNGYVGTIFRPNIQGAIISKAAAFSVPNGSRRYRHLRDVSTLLGMVRGDDRIYDNLSKSDMRHLRKMLASLDSRSFVLAELDDRATSRVTQFLSTATQQAPSVTAPEVGAAKRVASTVSKCGVLTPRMTGPCILPPRHMGKPHRSG